MAWLQRKALKPAPRIHGVSNSADCPAYAETLVKKCAQETRDRQEALRGAPVSRRPCGRATRARAAPIAEPAVSIFCNEVYRCADLKVAEGVPVVLAVEEGNREVEQIPGVAKAVELVFRIVKRGIDDELRLLLMRARGRGRPRAPDELRRLKELLDSITGFIADHGKDRHLKDEALKYACDVSGALS